MTATVHLHSVVKRYRDVTALDAVTTDFKAGVNVLLGPNAAGKTTLTETVARRCRPDEGHVFISNGDDRYAIEKSPVPRVGLAPQDLAVYPTLTMAENLKVFAELSGYSGMSATSHITGIARMLAMDHLLDRRVSTLSGGQQRCVHTAIALVGDPDVVLLDEPTVGVDVDRRRHLLGVVRSLGERGRVVIYTTHYLAELETLKPEHVVVLKSGTVQFSGDVDSLLNTAGAALILHFTRAPHPERLPFQIIADELTWSIETNAPEAILPEVLRTLGEDVSLVHRVELRGTDLESAYLQLVRERPNEPTLAKEAESRVTIQ